MVTRKWKVYGNGGHRQRASFFASDKYVSTKGVYEEFNHDRTGTHMYTLCKVTALTANDCIDILKGQLWDGAFECCQVGKIEEIISAKKAKKEDMKDYYIDKWLVNKVVEE